MLKIREEQMRAFTVAAVHDLQVKLPSMLLEAMPDLARFVSTQGLKKFADRSLNRAISYGFEFPRHIFIYVGLSALLGEDALERNSRTRALLTNKAMPANQRSKGLMDEAKRLIEASQSSGTS